jgi:hypothetical protein
VLHPKARAGLTRKMELTVSKKTPLDESLSASRTWADAFLDFANDISEERLLPTFLEMACAILGLLPDFMRLRDVLAGLKVDTYKHEELRPLQQWLEKLPRVLQRHCPELSDVNCGFLASILHNQLAKISKSKEWWLPGLPRLELLRYVLKGDELRLVLFLNQERGKAKEALVIAHLWPNKSPTVKTCANLRSLERRVNKKLLPATNGGIKVNREQGELDLVRVPKIL